MIQDCDSMIGIEYCTKDCEIKEDMNKLIMYIANTHYRSLVEEDGVLDCKKAIEIALLLIEAKRMDYG